MRKISLVFESWQPDAERSNPAQLPFNLVGAIRHARMRTKSLGQLMDWPDAQLILVLSGCDSGIDCWLKKQDLPNVYLPLLLSRTPALKVLEATGDLSQMVNLTRHENRLDFIDLETGTEGTDSSALNWRGGCPALMIFDFITLDLTPSADLS